MKKKKKKRKKYRNGGAIYPKKQPPRFTEIIENQANRPKISRFQRSGRLNQRTRGKIMVKTQGPPLARAENRGVLIPLRVWKRGSFFPRALAGLMRFANPPVSARTRVRRATGRWINDTTRFEDCCIIPSSNSLLTPAIIHGRVAPLRLRVNFVPRPIAWSKVVGRSSGAATHARIYLNDNIDNI